MRSQMDVLMCENKRIQDVVIVENNSQKILEVVSDDQYRLKQRKLLVGIVWIGDSLYNLSPVKAHPFGKPHIGIFDRDKAKGDRSG